MSFNRPRYDPCAFDKSLNESTSVLTYVLDPNKFYNCNQCRVEFGVTGGNNVSLFNGNLVDLESELRGQTRAYSRCPSRKFIPGTVIQGRVFNGCNAACSTSGLPCGSLACRKDDLRHLPACNLIQYRPKIDNIGYELNYPPCPVAGKRHRKN